MSKVQSILFDKNYYSFSDAIKWIKSHNFVVKKVDITENYYRIRQLDPKNFNRFRIIDIKPGIKFVIGFT
jgi:hypothetical protein